MEVVASPEEARQSLNEEDEEGRGRTQSMVSHESFVFARRGSTRRDICEKMEN